MTKIDIISGFLGAGKTTLIKKLIAESFAGQKVVLIENEFGEIGIDGGFLRDAGINVTEMNSGCICCSLVGDFREALTKVIEEYAPDRIVIEPSGVGKLSDVAKAVERVNEKEDKVTINSLVAVVDGTKTKMYMKNFGEFFNNQVESAGTIIISRTQKMDEAKLLELNGLLREHNKDAVIITTPWDDIKGDMIIAAMEKGHTLVDSLLEEMKNLPDEDEDEHEHHHHHHHDHDDHDHDHEEHEHHHHEHDEHCTCGCHDHDHDHEHHHADEVFQSWGAETARQYTVEEIQSALEALEDSDKYGDILRAKGIVAGTDGQWIHYDYVPGTPDVRHGCAATIGRLCVIGAGLKKDAIKALFHAE